MKKYKPYLIFVGMFFGVAILYKVVIKPNLPASIAAYLPF